MESTKNRREEMLADLKHGQIVMVTARWILVGAGLIFSFWNPGEIGRLRAQILFIFILAFANFYLHAQVLQKKPIKPIVVFLASGTDLLVVTIIVVSQGGFTSPAFVFYFPAVMAYAVALPGLVTSLLTSGLVFLYLLIGLFTIWDVRTEVTNITYQVLITRLLMLTAVAVCGYVYRRVELTRRQEMSEAEGLLKGQVSEPEHAPTDVQAAADL